MKKYYIYIILLVLFVSCGFLPPKWIHFPNGGKQAVSNSYKLSHNVFFFNSLIDSTICYINSSDLVITNKQGIVIKKEQTYYKFLCFNSDGICFVSNFMTEYPVEIELKQYIDYNWGQFCYYKTDGLKITIEIFNHDTKIFEYWYGDILANGNIHFYKTKGRPWTTYTSKKNDIYQKTDLKRLSPLNFPN